MLTYTNTTTMCDCLTKIKEEVLKHVTDSHAEKKETVQPIKEFDGEGILNTAFALQYKDDKFEITGTQLRTHFVYRYTFEKRDKTTSKPRVMNVSLAFSYCPFCGEAYKKPKGSIKVADVYTAIITPFCIDVCRIEIPIIAILKAINELNEKQYTGILFRGRLAYGSDKKNSISWSDFMGSYIPADFNIKVKCPNCKEDQKIKAGNTMCDKCVAELFDENK